MTDIPHRDRSEELEETLDPHRREERESVTAEVAARLRARGVRLTGTETSDEVANVLEAVERFERAVETHGGDLMVDTRPAREPDDPAFVLPLRGGRESVAAYVRRVDEVTAALQRRPRR